MLQVYFQSLSRKSPQYLTIVQVYPELRLDSSLETIIVEVKVRGHQLTKGVLIFLERRSQGGAKTKKSQCYI